MKRERSKVTKPKSKMTALNPIVSSDIVLPTDVWLTIISIGCFEMCDIASLRAVSSQMLKMVTYFPGVKIADRHPHKLKMMVLFPKIETIYLDDDDVIRYDPSLLSVVMERLSNLKNLDLSFTRKIKHLSLPKSLTYLNLRECKLHGGCLLNCSNLTHLDVGGSKTKFDLSYFTALNTLILDANPSDRGCLTKLTSLTRLESSGRMVIYPSNNNPFSNNALRTLTNLVSLKLTGHSELTDYDIQPLVSSLKELYLLKCDNITNAVIGKMINLKTMWLCSNQNIGDEGISSLTQLQTLVVVSCGNSTYGLNPTICSEFPCDTACFNITGRGVRSLTSLTSLSLTGNRHITDDTMIGLTQLKILTLINTPNVGDNGISYLKSLRGLAINGNTNITDEYLNVLSENLLVFNRNI